MNNKLRIVSEISPMPCLNFSVKIQPYKISSKVLTEVLQNLEMYHLAQHATSEFLTLYSK